ncbi:MAG: primosomal protein N' (replication factor Y) - superfamily II helicase [Rhodobacterales bacterium]|nr:MAG: primosomal protein N' (replication factor Y) - superfamily II helicase [Rhodobacterales bacterium]
MPVSDQRFPCEQCGADYRFAPQTNALVCDHCGHEHSIQDAPRNAIRELDFHRALEAQLPAQDVEETRLSHCPNCAAQITFEDKDHAAECPFCGTPVVIDTGLHRHIKPRAVAPFVLEEKQAREAMSEWLGALWFAPRGVQQYARKGRKMRGVYVPYWTFDADTTSTYSGERGTIYYETRTVMRDGKRVQQQVQKVRWQSARGRVTRFFDDVLVLASKTLPKRFTDALQPWDLSALQPYAPEYLAGFDAEGYTIALDDGYDEARRHMARVIERDVKFDIGGDRQRIHDINTDVRDVAFKHILLPIWLAAYKYRGKTYRFVVNGQTGRVQGERPWSVWKLSFAVILGLLIAGAVGYAIAVEQGAA